MARGPAGRRIPLLVNGSIDTKTNPKLVQPGALLDLENLYMLRTGEMSPRNGATKQTTAQGITGASNLFVTKNGGLGTITASYSASFHQFARFASSAAVGTNWINDVGGIGTVAEAYPNITAAVKGLQATELSTGSPADSIDPDICTVGGYLASTWIDSAGDGQIFQSARDANTGVNDVTLFPMSDNNADANRPAKCAATGTVSCGIWTKAGSIKAKGHANGVQTSSVTLGSDIDAASPWFDVKPIPGTTNFAVAYKVTAAGGVKCGIFNPATGTFTSTVTTAAADASFTLGWLDDQLATGNMFLATAGNTSGVVVRVMSATTMVVSATNVIDATAVAGIRNITGHVQTSAPTYRVLWDVSGSSVIYDKIKLARFPGPTIVDFAANYSLYSRSFQISGSKYFVLGCFSSSVQGTYTLIAVDPAFSSTQTTPQCHVLSGEASGRRLQASLSSMITDGTGYTIPVSRNRKVSTPTGAASIQTKTIAFLTFSVTTQVTHARELGGTVFVPGGVLRQDDGIQLHSAQFQIYPEQGSATTAVGGAMTAGGTYLYRFTYAQIDATGRIARSAGSVPLTVTLGGADGTANLSLFNPWLRRHFTRDTVVTDPLGAVYIEVWRRGPSASGATLYNKVGQTTISGTTDTRPFADTMSDANAAAGEAAYFNGNVLENFNPPGHSLLEVNGNRVGIVNAEDTSEFWFSKEYKAGAGIGFNPLLKVQISGDGAGGMTALASMDGRWILFKRSAIYVLSGDGPNDLGQGSFNAPQAVSRVLGTINAASVIETPDGIMFQAVGNAAAFGGMWLLDRGLNLSYVGAPVEDVTNQSSIVGAALSNGTTVRFVTNLQGGPVGSNGIMLEWDYFHKRWYRHALETDGDRLVDCANSPVFGWCYICQDGALFKEIPGQANDVNGSSLTIIPRVSFPHIQLAGLAGYQRLYALDITLDGLSSFTLSVDAEYDFSGALTGTPKTIALTGGTKQIQYTPPEGRSKCTSVRPVITILGFATSGTFKLTGVVAEIGVKRGSTIVAAQRMT